MEGTRVFKDVPFVVVGLIKPLLLNRVLWDWLHNEVFLVRRPQSSVNNPRMFCETIKLICTERQFLFFLDTWLLVLSVFSYTDTSTLSRNLLSLFLCPVNFLPILFRWRIVLNYLITKIINYLWVRKESLFRLYSILTYIDISRDKDRVRLSLFPSVLCWGESGCRVKRFWYWVYGDIYDPTPDDRFGVLGNEMTH